MLIDDDKLRAEARPNRIAADPGRTWTMAPRYASARRPLSSEARFRSRREQILGARRRGGAPGGAPEGVPGAREPSVGSSRAAPIRPVAIPSASRVRRMRGRTHDPRGISSWHAGEGVTPARSDFLTRRRGGAAPRLTCSIARPDAETLNLSKVRPCLAGPTHWRDPGDLLRLCE